MEEISSAKNPRVKKLRQLLKSARERRKTGLFVIEGPRMVFEAGPKKTEQVFVSESFINKELDNRLNPFIDKGMVIKLDDDLFGRVADTRAPQGIMAVVRMPEYSLREAAGEEGLIMALEDIQDPGNLGTIFRTAACAGVRGLILSTGCADVFSPKVVRSSMGAVLSVPFAFAESFGDALEMLRDRGIRLAAADLDPGGECVFGFDFAGHCAVVIGNEGSGVSRGSLSVCEKTLYIPMERGFESLNAAMSAGIIMYESKRQRVVSK